MDLSKIEGLNLTEDQKTAIMASHQTSIDAATTGLVNKNNELLSEKKTVQQLAADKDEALDQARLVATKAEEERLKLAGDVEGLKKHYEEQLAEATATANEAAKKAQDALFSRDKGSEMSKVLGLIHDDYKDIAKAKLSNMLKISYNAQGEVMASFEDQGKVVANNIDEFKGWAGEQDSFKKILNGVNSSGASTEQSRGISDAGSDKDLAFKQRLKSAGLTQ